MNSHFSFCQPKFSKKESGFLKIGEIPKYNLEDFQMLMRIIGCSHKQNESKNKIQGNPEITVSETESDESDKPKKDEECPES